MNKYEELDKLAQEYISLLCSHSEIWKPGFIQQETETTHRLSFTESDPIAVIKYKIAYAQKAI